MARGRSQIAAEVFALGVVLLLLVALPAGIFGYQAWRTASAGVRVVEIDAHAPERGGFTPDRLSLKAGETVRLRISSPDVVHGFAIPGLGVAQRHQTRSPRACPKALRPRLRGLPWPGRQG